MCCPPNSTPSNIFPAHPASAFSKRLFRRRCGLWCRIWPRRSWYTELEAPLDSAVAAEKLQREGYTDISLFAGGLDAWRKAGLPLEGEGVDFPVRDESPLPMFKEYMLIPEKSFIQWACHNTVHSHDGTLSVSGGELRFPHGPQGEGNGFLTMDMNGIACRDLAEDEMLPVLIAHLKSIDFFDVMAYPTAQLDILSLMPLTGATVIGAYAPLAGAAQRAAD